MSADIETAVASRDESGAEKAAIQYALDCIFGGGHGYERGDALTEADEDTCRRVVSESLTEYSERVDGDSDSQGLLDWIDRVAESAIDQAQARIDSLVRKTLTSTHYVGRDGQRYLPECLQGIEIEDGTIILHDEDVPEDDAERDEIEKALAGLGWTHEYDSEGDMIARANR